MSCTITAISYGRQIDKEYRKGMMRGSVKGGLVICGGGLVTAEEKGGVERR